MGNGENVPALVMISFLVGVLATVIPALSGKTSGLPDGGPSPMRVLKTHIALIALPARPKLRG